MSGSGLRRHASLSRTSGDPLAAGPVRPGSDDTARTVIPRQVRLPDGRVVTIRAIRRADTAGLMDFYARLSPESRRSRFFTASTTKRRVDADRLISATGRYDCVLVASATDRAGAERLAAVAQLADFGGGVEAALVVGDDYQGVGLGGVLFDHLLRAGQERGVRRVEATVLSNNNRILRILRHHQAKLGPAENGVLQATIACPATRPPAA